MNTTQQNLVTLFDEMGHPVAFVPMADFLDDQTVADLARYGIAL